MYSTLIDVSTLAAHIGQESWVVLDCRFNLADKAAGRNAYAAGRIPGAIYVDLEQDLSGPVTDTSGRHPLPDIEELVEKLGSWGIDETSQVVVYDDVGGGMAVRGWWLLRWLGHQGVALLDGGVRAWEESSLELTTEVSTPSQRRFVDRHGSEPVTGEALLGDQDRLLVDARSAPRFRGEEEPIDPVAGHIPGAVNLPFELNLDKQGRFLSAPILRERFLSALGGRDPGSVVHYCGSGVTACHNLLAMEHAGMHGSQLYVGSWSEWITDPDREVAVGE